MIEIMAVGKEWASRVELDGFLDRQRSEFLSGEATKNVCLAYHSLLLLRQADRGFATDEVSFLSLFILVT